MTGRQRSRAKTDARIRALNGEAREAWFLCVGAPYRMVRGAASSTAPRFHCP